MKSLVLFLLMFFSSALAQNLNGYLHKHQTPTIKYLKEINITEFDSGLKGVDCIYVVNLDERLDKWERTHAILNESNLKANRFPAINGWKLPKRVRIELSGPYPLRLRGGQVGCILSHLSVIKDGYDKGFNCIWLMEDDIEIVGDLNRIPAMLSELSGIDPNWDILYTDTDFRNSWGEYTQALDVDPRPDQMLRPLQYYLTRTLITETIQKVRNRYGMHSLLISRKGMKKILDYFSHIYLWTAIDIDIHFIPGIKEYSPTDDIITNWRHTPHSDTYDSSPLNPAKERQNPIEVEHPSETPGAEPFSFEEQNPEAEEIIEEGVSQD